jgi:hypothetical protein
MQTQALYTVYDWDITVKLRFYDHRLQIFSRTYSLFAGSWPNSHDNKVTLLQILCFCNFTSSLNSLLIFLVLAMKIYTILCFVVQLSRSCIQDNGPPSLLAITNSSVPKEEATVKNAGALVDWYGDCHLVVRCRQLHHRSPNSMSARSALGLTHLSTTATQRGHFVSPMSHKCTKEWPLQHSKHCFFVNKTFNRNAARLNFSLFLCSCDFTS